MLHNDISFSHFLPLGSTHERSTENVQDSVKNVWNFPRFFSFRRRTCLVSRFDGTVGGCQVPEIELQLLLPRTEKSSREYDTERVGVAKKLDLFTSDEKRIRKMLKINEFSLWNYFLHFPLEKSLF